jgi:hypothetical protein
MERNNRYNELRRSMKAFWILLLTIGFASADTVYVRQFLTEDMTYEQDPDQLVWDEGYEIKSYDYDDTDPEAVKIFQNHISIKGRTTLTFTSQALADALTSQDILDEIRVKKLLDAEVVKTKTKITDDEQKKIDAINELLKTSTGGDADKLNAMKAELEK